MFNENYCLDIATCNAVCFTQLSLCTDENEAVYYYYTAYRVDTTVCLENRRMNDLLSVLFFFRQASVVCARRGAIFHDFEEGRLSDQMFDKTHYKA